MPEDDDDDLGGAAAMGTTPDVPAVAVGVATPVELAASDNDDDPRVVVSPMPEEAGGDSGAPLVGGRLDWGAAAMVGACWTEFLREDFFDREVPTAKVLALLRLRFLITSVFSDRGRTTPCSLRNRPQALHRG